MTDYKILGQEAPSADTETDLYTVPGDKSTVVRAINVTNTASASDTFDIANIEGSLVETPTYISVSSGPNTSGGEIQVAASSTDGITWTQVTLPSSQRWSNVSYGGGTFVAIAGIWFNANDSGSFGVSYSPSAAAATSTDGVTWTASTMPSSKSWIAVTYGNNTFVAVSAVNSNAAAASTDGVTWTASTLPSSIFWTSVTYGNDIFVAISGSILFGISATAATSTDGITWTQRTLPVSLAWYSVVYGNNTFVAVGYNSAAATSTDGITWTARTLPSSQDWRSVAYGNNTFVAVSSYFNSSTVAATSTDGITWTARTLPSSQNWLSVTYGNNTFVAVALNSQISATSTNGVTWTQGTLPIKDNWQDITYGDVQSVTYPSTSNADYIFKSHEILGNETITIKGGYTLDSNNKLKIKSTNGTSTFHAFGGEI